MFIIVNLTMKITFRWKKTSPNSNKNQFSLPNSSRPYNNKIPFLLRTWTSSGSSEIAFFLPKFSLLIMKTHFIAQSCFLWLLSNKSCISLLKRILSFPWLLTLLSSLPPLLSLPPDQMKPPVRVSLPQIDRSPLSHRLSEAHHPLPHQQIDRSLPSSSAPTDRSKTFVIRFQQGLMCA